MKFLGERVRSIFFSIKFHSETELTSKSVNGNGHDDPPPPFFRKFDSRLRRGG